MKEREKSKIQGPDSALPPSFLMQGRWAFVFSGTFWYEQCRERVGVRTDDLNENRHGLNLLKGVTWRHLYTRKWELLP